MGTAGVAATRGDASAEVSNSTALVTRKYVEAIIPPTMGQKKRICVRRGSQRRRADRGQKQENKDQKNGGIRATTCRK